MSITDNGQEPPVGPGGLAPNVVGSPEIINESILSEDVQDGTLTPLDFDRSYVELAGDTMTGLLTLSAAPTLDLHASTKKYVDDSVSAIDLSAKVDKAGDTMTGFLTLNAAPTLDLHASTKKYVDDGISGIDLTPYLLLAGGTMSGNLDLAFNELQQVGLIQSVNSTSNFYDVDGDGAFRAQDGSAGPSWFLTAGEGDEDFPRFAIDRWGSLFFGDGTDTPDSGPFTTQSIKRDPSGTELNIKAGLALSGLSGIRRQELGDPNPKWDIIDSGLRVGPDTGAGLDTYFLRDAPGDWSTAGGQISVSINPFDPDHLTRKGYVDGLVPEVLNDLNDVNTAAQVEGSLLAYDGFGSYNALTNALLLSTGQLQLTENGPGAGIVLGNAGTVSLYRRFINLLGVTGGVAATANVFASTDLAARTVIGERGPANESGISFGDVNDVVLYRAGANVAQLEAGDTLRIQQDPVVDNDVVRKKYVDDLNFFESASARTQSTTTSATFQQKLTHTTATLVNGAVYKVSVTGSAGAADSSSSCEIRVDITGAATLTRTKASFGGPNDSANDHSSYAEQFVFTAGAAATAQIDIDYRRLGGSGTVSIDDIELIIERMS